MQPTSPAPLDPARAPNLGNNCLGFYDPRHPQTGFLSNFYRAPFRLQGFEWPTVEHFYQAHKSRDAEHQQQVRSAQSPKEAKRLGRNPALTLRPDWSEWRKTVMLSALIAKFVQNPPLAEQLLNTDDQILVETSPDDGFWGHGSDGKGENHLGYLLTTLRDLLRRAWPQARQNDIALDERDEQMLFGAMLSHHGEWLCASRQERAEAQVAALSDTLRLMVCDTNLTSEQFNQYKPGIIIQEPGFLTGSTDHQAGPAANTRFVLLAPNIRLVNDLSPMPDAKPAICLPGGHWKVMGRFIADETDFGQIVLLQVPDNAAYLFDSLIFSPFEAAIYQDLRCDFISAVAQPPLAACKSPEWLEQVSGPIGFTENGYFQELWVNGMAQAANTEKE